MVGYHALHDSRATRFRDAGSLSISLSLYLPISLSPYLPISLSFFHPISPIYLSIYPDLLELAEHGVAAQDLAEDRVLVV